MEASRAPFQLVSLDCLPVIRFHDMEEMARPGDLPTIRGDDCIEFHKRDSSDHLETRPPVHHMQSVRGSLSGPGLGPGWFPCYPTPTGGNTPHGSAAGGLGRGRVNLAISRRAEAWIGVGSWPGGETEAADGSFPRYLIRGRDWICRVRDGNWHQCPQPRPGERDALFSILGMGKPAEFRGVATGVRGIIELTQLQAGKGGVLSCILCSDAT